MTGRVVDASIFGPLFFEDESDEIFGGLPELLSSGECIAPQHWRLELVNQIVVGCRKQRLTNRMAEIAIDQIGQFAVEIDEQTSSRHREIFAIAGRHGLTACDAAYLELSMRCGASLATYDRALRAAARRENVEVLPE